MKRFWFFDLDGTLADTDRDIRMAWKLALGDLGLESPDFDEKFVTGPPIEEVVRTLFPGRCDEAMIDAARAGFGRRYDAGGFPNTREYPGVFERIASLKASGARVFIVTNKRYAGAMAIAEKFGWRAVFEGFYAGDMFKDDPKIGKLRKPELLALVMSRLGADANDSVLVGDTVSDFEAAAKNGVESVAVEWGYGTPEERAAATRIARTPKEI